MIDRTTMIWIGLIITAGFWLFHIKNQVQILETRLVLLQDNIAHENEAVHALRAEWSYLNDPQRIERLTRRHLLYRPSTPKQMKSIKSLPLRRKRKNKGTPVISKSPIETKILISITTPDTSIGNNPELIRQTRTLLAPPWSQKDSAILKTQPSLDQSPIPARSFRFNPD